MSLPSGTFLVLNWLSNSQIKSKTSIELNDKQSFRAGVASIYVIKYVAVIFVRNRELG